MPKILPFLLLTSLALACRFTPSNEDQEGLTSKDIEAREDSLALLAAYAAQAKIEPALSPDIETESVQAAAEEDAADDPAIWVHPTKPGASLIYGSNKKGGLAVYDLRGRKIAYYPIGNINNVDILDSYQIGSERITLLGCTNRSDQSIDLFRIDPENGSLQDIAAGTLGVDSSSIDDIYGFCFAHSVRSGKSYAVINGKNGRLQQFEIIPNAQAHLELVLVREVQFDSQTEGMVADEELGFLYVGEEGRGIWKLGLDPESGHSKALLPESGSDNPNIAYDIEGLTLYRKGDAHYLLASSQGNFSYAVFDAAGDNPYLFSFKIEGAGEIDGVEETDGLDVVSDSLSEAFPRGLLVVQDGFNYKGDSLQAQNFKLISWKRIVEIVPTKK